MVPADSFYFVTESEHARGYRSKSRTIDDFGTRLSKLATTSITLRRTLLCKKMQLYRVLQSRLHCIITMAAFPSPAIKLKSKVPNAVKKLVRRESFENAKIERNTTVSKLLPRVQTYFRATRRGMHGTNRYFQQRRSLITVWDKDRCETDSQHIKQSLEIQKQSEGIQKFKQELKCLTSGRTQDAEDEV